MCVCCGQGVCVGGSSGAWGTQTIQIVLIYSNYLENVCVCVCVSVRGVCVCVCVCVCVLGGGKGFKTMPKGQARLDHTKHLFNVQYV